MLSKNVVVTLGQQDYRCTATDGKHHFHIDEPVDVGGGDTAPTPTALLLGSLGSCSAITIKMYAQRKAWDLQHVEVSLNVSHRIEEQKRVTVFLREVKVHGNLDHAQIKRLLEIVKACPVSRMLEGKVDIETRLGKPGEPPLTG